MSWGKVPGQAPRWEVYSVFVIHRFCTCEFAHSLQCMCNSQITAHGAFEVTSRHEHSSEKFEVCAHSQLRWNKCSAFLFQLLCYKQEFFLQCLVLCFCIISFSVHDFAVWNHPRGSANAQSSVPKHKKAVICLTEKIMYIIL